MIVFYNVLVKILSPFLKLYFYQRCLYGKDKIESVKNHFGVATVDRPNGNLMWVHAASIGESATALTFIKHIKKKFPDLNILITTITVTSAEIISSKISEISGCYHQFVVADNISWIKKFLNYWNIDIAVFLESEIWPNTITELHNRKIPMYLLNARLSEKSFRRWKMVKSFLSSVLKKFNSILAQSKLDAERFSFFSNGNVKRIDNLKYANAILPCNDELLEAFQKLCTNKKVFVAASTHGKEEEIILDAHKKLSKHFDLITIIIPRHLTRIGKICDTLKKHGYDFFLRSNINEKKDAINNNKSDKKSTIYCVDTFGELGTFFRLADVCFVGGSLVPIGGHNIYEPVALGKPVLHGSFMNNALEVRDFLKTNKVAFEVLNSEDIYKTCNKMFSNKSILKEISTKALQLTKNNSLKEIDEILQLEKIF